ncbi:hypothetical protein LguiA_012078 [Lonicera macranthoides]
MHEELACAATQVKKKGIKPSCAAQVPDTSPTLPPRLPNSAFNPFQLFKVLNPNQLSLLTNPASRRWRQQPASGIGGGQHCSSQQKIEIETNDHLPVYPVRASLVKNFNFQEVSIL